MQIQLQLCKKPERKADKAHTEKSRLYVTEVIWYLQTFFLLSVFLSTVILGEIMAVVIIAMMLSPDDSDQ